MASENRTLQQCKVQLSNGVRNLDYSKHLNTGLVWYLNGRFVFDCQRARYLNGGQKTGLHFFKCSTYPLNHLYTHLYLYLTQERGAHRPVHGLKCPVFEWSTR